MTQSQLTTVDLYPDFTALTTGALETLCDRAFTQLEDGPVVEGLMAFYHSLTAEIEDRLAQEASTPSVEAPGPAPAATDGEPRILQAAG